MIEEKVIYHFVLPEVWAEFRDKDFYEVASLATEGFIHCSFAAQIEKVLERYFKDAKKVLILHLETDKLTAKLVVEPSTGGELYPHVYGKINCQAIVKIEEKVLRGDAND
jgi:uncharacterized protein (DUF952 family)